MSIIQEALKKAQVIYSDKAEKSHVDLVPRKVIEEITSSVPKGSGVSESAELKSHYAGIPLAMLIPAIIVLTIVIGFGFKSFFSGRSSELSKEPVESRQEVSYKADGIDEHAGNVGDSIKNSIPTTNFMIGRMPELVLNGIMYLDGGPRAIINGSMVEAGDMVSGAKVTSITRDTVVLSYNSGEITLKLKE